MEDACVLSAVISVHNEVTDVCEHFFKYDNLFFLSQELRFIKIKCFSFSFLFCEGYIKIENFPNGFYI